MKRRETKWSAALLALAASLGAGKALAVHPGLEVAQQPSSSAQFRGGGAAEIPARFVGGLVFLPVAVDRSQPSLFELDSTAPASTIDPDRRAELGIVNLQAAVLNLSGVDVTLASLGELAKKDFAREVGRAYEGTLGNDFLAATVVEINFARQTVRLYDPAAYQYAGRGKSVRLSFVGGLPVVHARINVAGSKTAEGDFIVNTALDASLLISPTFAESHKLRPRKTIPSAEFAAGSSDRAELSRVNAFDIGPFTIVRSIGVFPRTGLPTSDRRLAGELGAKLLRRFIVTFDYPHQQIILDASTNFRSDELEDMSGVEIVANGPALKRFEVTEVWPHTPGADAGIRQGDVIEGINDEAAADLSLAEIRSLFRQPAARYNVLIGRGTQTVNVSLRMRRLLD
ncbi:MAG TPA: PDZ domain-containing protein [Candidatus Acidoferrales bacterium]|nr:PDZ domain-containing protein [Candidatus Acidoferrales bacterium]